MEYRSIGKSDIPPVSRLCFGALTVGPLQSGLPVEEGARVILSALEREVNFIDTAQLYGTYAHIRRALELWGKKGAVISTKTYAHTRELAERALNEALEALGRDYIDIFMLHEQESIHTIRGHREALEYLLEAKRAGKIRAVGLSTHRIAGMRGALEYGGFDLLHPIYNIAGLGIHEDVENRREAMGEAIAEAADKGIFVLTMKPLGGGHLYRRAAEAFNFLLDDPSVGAVAVGMKTEQEVEDNVSFFESRTFPAGYAGRTADSSERALQIADWCEGCGKCAGACPQGALELRDGRAVCDCEKCVLCGYCAPACGMFAIRVN